MKFWLKKMWFWQQRRMAGRNPDMSQQHDLIFTLKLYQTANQFISSGCIFEEQNLSLILFQSDLKEPADLFFI